MAEIVGYLFIDSSNPNKKVEKFHCAGCVSVWDKDDGIPLYKANIFPYNQSCHLCNKKVVEGRSVAWGQMFDRKPALGFRMVFTRKVSQAELAAHLTNTAEIIQADEGELEGLSGGIEEGTNTLAEWEIFKPL